MSDPTESTAQLGKYASLNYVQTFDAKLVNDDNLALTIEIEPKWKTDKPKRVRVYLRRPEIKKLRAAMENR